jgi:four helix bundle protein
MVDNDISIKEFTELVAWQKSHVFVLALYKATELFPKTEQFGLISQMRRAAVSVTSNIAEGFGRRSTKEKQQFFFVAVGSLYELQNQLLIVRDLSFIDLSLYNQLEAQLLESRRLIFGLIQSADRASFY